MYKYTSVEPSKNPSSQFDEISAHRALRLDVLISPDRGGTGAVNHEALTHRQPIPSSQDISRPAILAFASPALIRTWLCWVAIVVVMGLLFLWWPYQKWTFSGKVSVLSGWVRVLAADRSGEWIFCPLVPLISLWLAWRDRRQLRSIPLRGHSSGLCILLIGAFVFWAGYKAGTGYPGFAAAQVVLAGLLVWLCGWEVMRVLVFPWMFLVFMWPGFPLEAQLAVPMRIMAANLTAHLLSFVDLAAVSRGTALLSAAHSPHGLAEGVRFKLDVAAACSGLRSLYALLMLAALSGYWFLRRWLPRSILLFSVIPLALVGNIVRLLLLAIGTVWMGEEFAVGIQTSDGEEASWFHQFAGMMVYAAALGGMFALCSLLERSRWNRSSEPRISAVDRTGDDDLRVTMMRVTVSMAFAGLLLGLCAFAGGRTSSLETGVITELPRRFGPSEGTELPMSDRERAALPEDITISRMMYASPSTLPMQVAVVLDGVAGRGLHQPEICAVAQAWRILDEKVVPVKVADREIHATMLRLFMDVEDRATGRMMRRRGIHVFWYQGAHGVTAANHSGHLFKTYWESVFKNVNHRWALISFSTYLPASAPDGSDDAAESTALADLKSVIVQMSPMLLKPVAH